MTASPPVVDGAPPRSLLFVPGDRVEAYLDKADAAGPDAIIIDLEDAVDAERKSDARAALGPALRRRHIRRPVFVRINRRSATWQTADLEAAAASGAVGVVVPKCEAPDDVARLVDPWVGVAGRQPVILALLETARGIRAAAEIAAAHPAVVGIALGAEDLAADVGLRRTRAGAEILVARSLVTLAAASTGRWAIDTPCLELRDLRVVARDARRAADLGFDGKLVIHPSHVATVHRAFTPSDREIEEARRTVAAGGSMAAERRGVIASGGRMVDRPVLEAAEAILRRADRASSGWEASDDQR
jgi:citrate lyase beta subunit